MEHYGNIEFLSGCDLPVVDCITGGSPCQDLSIAGKRAGLKGDRSGLFTEQIRIIKEMRERDRANGRTGSSVRPRFMVWENVPGAFSSGTPKGADFAAVLEEIIKVCEPGADLRVSVPNKGWTKSGCYYAEDGAWSIAWRVHDAQFWGVPQRRRRIALVADFGGMSAPEILFVRQSLSGDFEQGKSQREEAAGDAGNGIDKPIAFGISSYESNAMKPGNPHSGIYAADTCRTLDSGNCCNPACNQGGILILEPRSQDGLPRVYTNERWTTLNTAQRGQRLPCVCVGNGQLNQISMTEQANTLDTMHDQQAVLVFGLDSNKNGYIEQAGTLQSHGSGGMQEMCCDRRMIVRRLTPLECERLQGFPDGWTDIGEWVDNKGKIHKSSDTARYKALGNSIALPFWFWLLRRISAQYERPATMGSLFDGIGGFPLCWERCNGKGTAIWASEIEEFCIAVTKRRFGRRKPNEE